MFHKNASRFATRFGPSESRLPEKRPVLQQDKQPISMQITADFDPGGPPISARPEPPAVCQGSAKVWRPGSGATAPFELLLTPLRSRARETPIAHRFCCISRWRRTSPPTARSPSRREHARGVIPRKGPGLCCPAGWRRPITTIRESMDVVSNYRHSAAKPGRPQHSC
jgi:hypothetical protein